MALTLGNLQGSGGLKNTPADAAVRQAETQERRKQRAFNLAYRDAIRSGDRRGALDILLRGEEVGVPFGGVRPAGQTESQVRNRMGESLLTLKEQRGELRAPQNEVVVEDVVDDVTTDEEEEPKETKTLFDMFKFDGGKSTFNNIFNL